METTTEQNEIIARESESNFYNSEQVKEYAKNDMDFFGAVAAPDVLTLQFPSFYVYLWHIVIAAFNKPRDFSKFALGFPRGHAKTMVVKLLILYAILFTQKKYILVIGANQKKARAIISDVCDMLDSYNIQSVFGNWRYAIQTDTQDQKKFTFNGRAVILEGAGQGTSIRGSNEKNARPDLMVFDDAQTSESAASLTEAGNFQTWFLGTALKAKSPTGCTFIYIGNMYKDVEIDSGSGVYTCMLRNLQKSTEWTSFIVGAILEDSTALWPELHSLDSILAEYRFDVSMNRAEIFYSEILNDPTACSSFYFDASKVKIKQPYQGEIHNGNYLVIDPATSKVTPDQVVIGYFEVYENTPHFAQMEFGKFTGPETVQKSIDLCLQLQCSNIFVESNAYQHSLCDWFQFFFDKLALTGIHVEPVYSTTNKTSRLLRSFVSWHNRECTVSQTVYPHVVTQAGSFNPRVTNNLDDIIDTAEIGMRIPAKYMDLLVIPGDLSNINSNRFLPNQTNSPPQLPF